MKKLISGMAFAVLCLMSAGCGSNQTPTQNIPTANLNCPNGQTYVQNLGCQSSAANTCGMGSVYTQQGCLTQGTCPAGQGQYQNQCIPGTNTLGTSCQAGQVYVAQYGCLPQGNCPYGQAYLNGQCIAASNTYNNGYNSGYNNGYNYNSGYNSGYNYYR